MPCLIEHLLYKSTSLLIDRALYHMLTNDPAVELLFGVYSLDQVNQELGPGDFAASFLLLISLPFSTSLCVRAFFG